MADYIDRNELVGNLDKFAPEHLTPLLRTLIEKQPTADVVEVRHGHWIKVGKTNGGSNILQCSVCGTVRKGVAKTRFCKDCGAKMDGGDKL